MPTIPLNISVVILAAGASKRMGVPKQLLKWNTSTLLGHAIETALKLPVKEVIVVLGANFSIIEKEIEHYPITILNNKEWEIGLGKSIAFGIKHIMLSKFKIDGCLITLADQPFIKTEFLNILIEAFLSQKNHIIATCYKNKKEGVPVIFDTVYFEDLLKLDDDKGAKSLLKKNKSSLKALEPDIDNVDLDSKADYEKLYKKNFNI